MKLSNRWKVDHEPFDANNTKSFYRRMAEFAVASQPLPADVLSVLRETFSDVSKFLKEDRLFPAICLYSVGQQVTTIPIDQTKARTPEIKKFIMECQGQQNDLPVEAQNILREIKKKKSSPRRRRPTVAPGPREPSANPPRRGAGRSEERGSRPGTRRWWACLRDRRRRCGGRRESRRWPLLLPSPPLS